MSLENEEAGKVGDCELVRNSGNRWVQALGRALLTFCMQDSPRYSASQKLRVIQINLSTPCATDLGT